MSLRAYHLTLGQLLLDLHQAYYDARRHKRQKPYQLRFELNLEANLAVLCDELWSRSYMPQSSTCFIITEPKRREVFAADFRDRVVHHLYFNYTHESHTSQSVLWPWPRLPLRLLLEGYDEVCFY